ncbi:hypothetical protein ACFLR2_01380 [Chlamydiota bacterium]
MQDPNWGTFISPDRDLENLPNPNEKYQITVLSGHKANFSALQSQNPFFDSITTKITEQRATIHFEDQCSGAYYFDIFNITEANKQKINKIVEVGVFMGGASCILAGQIEDSAIELDLVDANPVFLRFTYERIRRAFPKAALRVRLFFGDLPTYVKNVLSHAHKSKHLIHHDASHNFNEVVRDLASLSFVQDKIVGLMIQDTHLRSSNIHYYVFVDAALYAVFGSNMQYLEIGSKYSDNTNPAFEEEGYGTYFLGGHPEGIYIPFFPGLFRYPHARVKLEHLFL